MKVTVQDLGRAFKENRGLSDIGANSGGSNHPKRDKGGPRALAGGGARRRGRGEETPVGSQDLRKAGPHSYSWEAERAPSAVADEESFGTDYSRLDCTHLEGHQDGAAGHDKDCKCSESIGASRCTRVDELLRRSGW